MFNLCIFFFTSLFTILTYNFFKCDLFNKCLIKYEKWKSLKGLVSTQHKSKIIVNLISFNMVLKSLYLSFIQYMNNSVIKTDKNKYEVSYIINGKLYKMIVTPSRGPSPILCITDKYENDITEKIIPYLGPNNDWHNKKFYPDFFHEELLNIELSSGENKVFRHSETIEI